MPLYHNHYARYSQYLPLDTLSSRTSSFRSRIASTLGRYLLPSHMRWRSELGDHRGSLDDLYFGEEEGESMVGFDVNRRERSVRGGRVVSAVEIDSQRRLSRDLEGGFMDSGDDEEEDSANDDRRR